MTEERLKAILEEKSTKIFSDYDTMKKMGATSASGATKRVLVFQNRGFVLKCDRYPGCRASYCQAEFENYKSAVKEGIEKILLPTTEYCTGHDGIVFYKQPIYKTNSNLNAEKLKLCKQKFSLMKFAPIGKERLKELLIYFTVILVCIVVVIG